MSARSNLRLARHWLSLLLAVSLLSACGGGSNPPSGGGGSGGGSNTPVTGFAVFTSNRTQPSIEEPWIATYDGSDYRSLAAGLPGGGNIRVVGARLSPDGSYLALATDSGTDHSYAIINIATGAINTLPLNTPRNSGISNDFFWSSDSTRLTLNLEGYGSNPNYTPSRVFVMNANGSSLFEPVVSGSDDLFTNLSESAALHTNSWSPAGSHFTVLAKPLDSVNGTPNPDENENLHMVRSDGTGVIDIMPAVGDERRVQQQVWARDGSKFAFNISYDTSSGDAAYLILAHDPGTGVTLQLATPNATAETSLTGISADGDWLSYSIETGAGGLYQLYTISSTGGVSTPISSPPTGTLTEYDDVTWAPAGDQLVYERVVLNGTQNTRVLYLADANGGSMPLHTTAQSISESTFGFAWSPDARFIAFTTVDPGNPLIADLYVFDTSTGNPAVHLTAEPEFTRGGDSLVWSPDSQWLYARQFDDVQQVSVVRAYPAGNWSSVQTLGIGGESFGAPSAERGTVAIHPTPDSSGVLWRRRDVVTSIVDLLHGDPTDPTLTRVITQPPSPGPGPGNSMKQVFAR